MRHLYPLYSLMFVVSLLPKGWSDGIHEYLHWLYKQGLYGDYLAWMTVWPKGW